MTRATSLCFVADQRTLFDYLRIAFFRDGRVLTLWGHNFSPKPENTRPCWLSFDPLGSRW